MKNDIPQSLLELYPSTNQYFVDTFKSLEVATKVDQYVDYAHIPADLVVRGCRCTLIAARGEDLQVE